MALSKEEAVQILKLAMLSHEAHAEAALRAKAERDDAIRQAVDAGVSYAELVTLTGLSEPRIGQIRRRSRV